MRPKEKKRTKNVSQLGVRLRSKESDIQAQDMGLVSRLKDVGPEQLEGSTESRTKTQSSQDANQMSQHFWLLFRIFVEFSCLP